MLLRSIIISVLFLNTSLLFSQQHPNYKIFTQKISHKDSLVNLPDEFVIQHSDRVTLNNIIISPDLDYEFDYRNGIVKLSNGLFSKYDLDTNLTYELTVQYDAFPYFFEKEYSNFDILIERDTITGDTIEIATQRTDFIGSLFEGTELEKSGSLFRGITVGTNRDLSLNSGFRLQLSGNLSKDIEIIAALTDESTPIQPEGNTQRLQELDKVFIEARSSNIVTTIGDINIDFNKTEFARFQRKIQGAKGFGEFNFGNLLLSGAVSRGKFNTNSFNGQDGVQGPYRLIGRDNETNILVLAGSERVFLDGVSMTRGEQADYIIDYGIGEVTFTNKRIITSNSRIIVDFEYSDRKYSRTLLAGNNRLNFLNNNLNFEFTYINEFDNPDKTIDFTLTEEDKRILENAGDDKFKAIKSGVTLMGVDTNGIGLGAYVKADTVINSSQITFYRYQPGTPNSLYNVTFSFVGQGHGSYRQQTFLQYNFAGPGNGNYDTIIFLPIPTAYQIADVKMSYSSSPLREFYADVEAAYSFLDANKFSPLNNEDNGGVAFNGVLGLSKSAFNFLGMKINHFDLTLKQKVVNKLFNSLERFNAVEFNRQYNITDSLKLTENLTEAAMNFYPVSSFSLSGNFGMLKRGDRFTATRTNASLLFSEDSLRLPTALYKIEIINSDDKIINRNGNWIKHFGRAGYRKFFGSQSFSDPNIEFTMTFEAEDRQNYVSTLNGDSLIDLSTRFYEYRPRISFNNIFDFNIYSEFNYRNEDRPFTGLMLDEANSYTQIYGLQYNGLRWFSPVIELSIRDKEYTETFRNLGFEDNRTVLVNSLMRIDPLNGGVLTDLLYNVSSEKTPKIERVFILVRQGEGNYIYLGDLNNNGIQDENEFELTIYNDGNYIRINRPTDELFPTVDLKSSARINFRPARIFNIAGTDFLSDLVKNTSVESFYRVEEKSKDPDTDNLYFLRFNTFQNDTNTLTGTELFQQDINFFEFNPAYSLKLRFIQLKSFNQFAGGNERGFSIQKLARLKVGLTNDLTTQVEYLNNTDRGIGPLTSVRNRNINSDGFTTDFSYRPTEHIESGLQVNFTKAIDSYPFVPTNADINQQILRFIYSFTMLGRVRLEIERNEIELNKTNFIFPFELTNGRSAGKSLLWRAFLDYSISKNIQATVTYDGRSEEDKRVIHTGRAEVKAFF
jgi:hypothetical protein